MALTSLALTAATKRLSSALILASSPDSARTPVGDTLSATANMKAAIVAVGLFISLLPYFTRESPDDSRFRVNFCAVPAFWQELVPASITRTRDPSERSTSACEQNAS